MSQSLLVDEISTCLGLRARWHDAEDAAFFQPACALVAQQGAKSAAGKEFAAPEERVPAVNVEDRKLAEFTDDEVQVILRQAGFRTIA